MIEVPVPKDVTVHEPPLVGPLTTRQTICAVVVAAVEYGYYMALSALNIPLLASDSDNIPLLIGIALAVPILYIATGKPYGMRAEVYLYYYLLPSLVASKDRPYATKLLYDSILEEEDRQEEEKQLRDQTKNRKKAGKTGKTAGAAKKPDKKKKPRKAGGKDTVYA